MSLVGKPNFTVLSALKASTRTDRLWPRALLTPFTDNVELTAGDQRAYTSYASAERYKDYQHITVDFGHDGHTDPADEIDASEPEPSDDESGTPWRAR